MPVQLPSDEIVASLKAKYGEVHVLKNEFAAVVVRKPKREEYRRFRAEIFDEARQSDANENLVVSIVVWPASAEFDALLDEFPALCEDFGKQVSRLLGNSRNADAKKL